MANYVPFRANNAEGCLEALDAGDGLLLDFIERLSTSGDISIGTLLTPVAATGTVTVTGVTAAGQTITINGTVLTAVAGARTPGSDDFSISSGTAAGIAADIDAAINDGANSFTGIVTSSVASNVVTLTAVPAGDAGNAITLATSDAGNFTLSGANLTGGDTPEIVLGATGTRTHVEGDLLVDGSSTISVNEVVQGSFTVEGDTTLGDNNGDTVNLGGGTSDTVNLNADLTVGAGTVGIGSGAADYVNGLWVQAVNDNGPDADAYDIRASGTNAGAYAVGIDASLLANTSATDLMTALDDLDAAITAGGDSTNSTTYTINADATAGVAEDACLVLRGGDGGTSLITTEFCQDTSEEKAFIRIEDNGTEVNPVLSIGDTTGADAANLVSTLQFTSTNNVPANVIGNIEWQVNGADTHGDLIFGGAGLTTDSIVGTSNDNVVDLGTSTTNRFRSAYFGTDVEAGNDITAGNSFVVGNTSIDTDSLDNSNGAFTIDLVNAAADGTLTLTNTGAGATGADIDFATAGSAIVRSGDGAAEIPVANLLDSAAAETVTGGWTFDTANVTFDGIATAYTETTDPTNAANTGFLYTKDDAGDTELFYQDDDGNIVQITQDGALAVGDVTETLQEAYEAGNTVDVTSAEGIITFRNDTATDTTTVLSVSRAPGSATAGTGLDLSMGANTTGVGLNVAAAGTGDAVLINNTGTGDALDVQDSGASVLQVTGDGAVNITPTSGQSTTITMAGAGGLDVDTATGAIEFDSSGAGFSVDVAGASNVTTTSGNLTLDAANGELVFDDTGNSGLTLSQASDRTLDQTASGEVFENATSVVGGLNALANGMEVEGRFSFEYPVENGVTISAGDVVAASSVSGRITQGNAGLGGERSIIGIALTTGTGDAGGTVSVRVALPGSVVDVAGGSFTAGTPVFAPTTPGPPSDTFGGGAGSRNLRMGYALTSTVMVLQPVSGFIL